MRVIGVRELKANISEILRQVEEEGEVVEVTRHGHVIARLMPVEQVQSDERDSNGTWTQLNELIREISTKWPEGVTAQDAINDVRREL
jgi:prevent-host-death family protein